jgi:hypothetical protein
LELGGGMKEKDVTWFQPSPQFFMTRINCPTAYRHGCNKVFWRARNSINLGRPSSMFWDNSKSVVLKNFEASRLQATRKIFRPVRVSGQQFLSNANNSFRWKSFAIVDNVILG